MASTSRSAGVARRVRRSVAWHRKEYVNGALWVLPTAAALLALAAGYVMSPGLARPDSLVDRLAFQGTGDDARALLITVSSTVVTVIALVGGAGSTFSEYVRFIGDVLGRYGASEVSVMLAFTRLLRNCVEVLPAGSERLQVLDEAAETALADVERAMTRPSDTERVRAAVTSLRHTIAVRRGHQVAPAS